MSNISPNTHALYFRETVWVIVLDVTTNGSETAQLETVHLPLLHALLPAPFISEPTQDGELTTCRRKRSFIMSEKNKFYKGHNFEMIKLLKKGRIQCYVLERVLILMSSCPAVGWG